jgi:hypothetical protein
LKLALLKNLKILKLLINRVNQKRNRSAFVKVLDYGTENFLAACVPDLQFKDFVVNLEINCGKLEADCG